MIDEQRHSERRVAETASTLDPPPIVVTALATTPVKGLRILARDAVTLTPLGVSDDRRFYLIDELARMVNGKAVGILAAVSAEYDEAAGRLTLHFPDGMAVSEIVTLGPAVTTRVFSRSPVARLVQGPWAQAISRYVGRPLRLVECERGADGIDRGADGAISLISGASLARLAQQAGVATIDARRFRMLIEVAGSRAHEEDEWVGRSLRIGAARVEVRGHVGRCLVTSQSPESGLRDLATLELLSYRRGLPTTERLAFGVYGAVLEPGVVRVGDELTLG